MSHEGPARRVMVAAERLADLADQIRDWAAGYPPGDMPPAIRGIIDAADDYRQQLDQYAIDNNQPKKGTPDSP